MGPRQQARPGPDPQGGCVETRPIPVSVQRRAEWGVKFSSPGLPGPTQEIKREDLVWEVGLGGIWQDRSRGSPVLLCRGVWSHLVSS